MKEILACCFLGIAAATGCTTQDSQSHASILKGTAGSEVNRIHDSGSVGVHTSTETEKAYNRDNERSVDSSDKH